MQRRDWAKGRVLQRSHCLHPEQYNRYAALLSCHGCAALRTLLIIAGGP